MAKSIVKKVIRRKIQTAKFEALDIELEVEEQIIWDTEEERIAATAKLSKRLLDDFTKTYNEVVERIGVDRCIGVVNAKGGKSGNSGKPGNNGSEVDFDFS